MTRPIQVSCIDGKTCSETNGSRRAIAPARANRKPTPHRKDDSTQLNAYVFFNGNAEDALNFYRDALGSELEIMRFEGTPAAASAPADWGTRSCTAWSARPRHLMASDATTDRVKNPGDNFALSFSTDVEAEADEAFARLSADRHRHDAVRETSWGAKFGMFTDKFGIS